MEGCRCRFSKPLPLVLFNIQERNIAEAVPIIQDPIEQTRKLRISKGAEKDESFVEENVRNRIIETASFNTDSPKIIENNRGSASNTPNIEMVACY